VDERSRRIGCLTERDICVRVQPSKRLRELKAEAAASLWSLSWADRDIAIAARRTACSERIAQR
jgi:hypothetical protein